MARRTPRLPAVPAPAAAYRRDLGPRQQAPFGPLDGLWLVASVHLSHATRGDHRGRRQGLTDASAIARAAIEQSGIARDVPANDETSLVLEMIADLEDAGAFHLAACTLVNLYGAVSGPLDHGRIIAQFARVCRKRGDLDAASYWFQQLEALARSLGGRSGDELMVRSWIGFGALAQVAGNYPEMSVWSHRAVRLARVGGFDRLEAVARSGVFVRSAMRGRSGLALLHADQMLRLAAGDARIEAEILTNVGRLLLDVEEYDGARAVSAAVMVRTRAPRFLLPALGAYAVSCARLGRTNDTRWALAEVQRVDDRAMPPYERTMLIADAARAAQILGWTDEWAAFAVRGAALAEAHEIHEASFAIANTETLDEVTVAPSARAHENVRLRRPVESATRRFASFQPATLPLHVVPSLG